MDETYGGTRLTRIEIDTMALPATNTMRLRSSSYRLMLTWAELAISVVHLINQSSADEWSSLNPTEATVSPPAVFLQDKGTRQISHRTKKQKSALRYSWPLASR